MTDILTRARAEVVAAKEHRDREGIERLSVEEVLAVWLVAAREQLERTAGQVSPGYVRRSEPPKLKRPEQILMSSEEQDGID